MHKGRVHDVTYCYNLGKNAFLHLITVFLHTNSALSSAEASLRYGEAFVLWGGWGERKRKRAGHDGKEEERREASAI